MRLNLLNSIRTNNFSDKQVNEKIKGMWEEAYSKLKEYKGDLYGIYYDYTSDYKGDYSLGVAISGSNFSNNDSSVIEVPDTQNDKIFDVDTTDGQGIFKAWSKIWDLEEAGSLKRAYTYDYEKYYPNGEIEIHIAIIKEK